MLEGLVDLGQIAQVPGKVRQLLVLARRGGFDVSGQREKTFDRDRDAIGIQPLRRGAQLSELPPPVADGAGLSIAVNALVDQRVGQEVKPFRGLIEPAVDDRHRDLGW